MDSAAADGLLDLRNLFHANRASFVLCELQPAVKKYFEQNEQFEILQITPTQSEASDIIYHGRNRKGIYGLISEGNG